MYTCHVITILQIHIMIIIVFCPDISLYFDNNNIDYCVIGGDVKHRFVHVMHQIIHYL